MIKTVINGKEYESVRAACKANGISICALYDMKARIKESDSRIVLENMINGKHNVRGKINKIIREHGYHDIYALCDATGIPMHTLYGRIKNGFSFEDAIKPSVKKRGIECTVFGETFPSRIAACRAYGVSYDYVYKRSTMIYKDDDFCKIFEDFCIKNNKTRIKEEHSDD